MKVILKENIEKLGFKDEIVDVKNGYARNFLIPKNKAVIATENAVKVLNENFIEISSVLQSAFDDAVLIGCDEDDFKKKVTKLINSLEFSIGKE